MAQVAFLLADDFEDSEFKGPYDRIIQAGHEVTVIGAEARQEVRGKQGKETFVIDASIDSVAPEQFQAVVIPGGYSPDHLRLNQAMVGFARQAMTSNMPVAAICHAPSLLIDTGALSGMTVTSWPSIRTDLVNAGANWVDKEVCRDQNLITSRNPDDIPAFASAIIAEL